MVPGWIVGIVALAALLFIGIVKLRWESDCDRQFRLGVEAGEAKAAKDALAAVRKRGRRFEVQVWDWGATSVVQPHQRFRWMILDADRFLDPEIDPMAVRPFAMGNEPDWLSAYAAAVRWLDEENIGEWQVVIPTVATG